MNSTAKITDVYFYLRGRYNFEHNKALEVARRSNIWRKEGNQ